MVAMQGSASQAGLTREGASWASPPTPSFGHDPSSDLGRSVQVCDLILRQQSIMIYYIILVSCDDERSNTSQHTHPPWLMHLYMTCLPFHTHTYISEKYVYIEL